MPSLESSHPSRLLVRRGCGARSPSHYVLSNAGDTVSMAHLHACRCFFIEHTFREPKSELSMADYQVRRWDAWHHHMALMMIATLFLVKRGLALQDEALLLSLADLVLVMGQLLPRPEPAHGQLATA